MGKTVEAVARDYDVYLNRLLDKTLVIAPLGTLESWRDTFLEYYQPDQLRPGDIIAITEGRNRFLDSLKSKSHSIYLLNWESLRTGLRFWAGKELYPVLKKTLFHHIIADEVHKCKNRKAQQTLALKQIKGTWKTALSGTPITNKPDDLWSILHWAYPKEWTSYWKFVQRYTIVEKETNWEKRKPYWIISGTRNEAELQERISPYVVQRRKKDVAPELPDKLFTKTTVELDPKQRRAYDSMAKNMVAWIGAQEDQTLVASVIIARLQRLQQFAIAHAEIEKRINRNGEVEEHVVLREPSSKLDAVMEILEDAPQEQFVIFTQFRGTVDLLRARLARANITHSLVIGGQSDRQDEISQFIKGNSRVLVGTIAAGGTGLDGLQVASNVVFIDRSWSPPLNTQAEDRLHRFGQVNAVNVIDIVAKNTLDLGKEQKLELKKRWVRDLLG